MSCRDLPRYDEFHEAVNALRIRASSLQEFTSILKTDDLFKRLRNNARNELRSIYEEVRRDLKLPPVAVYFPPKKKVQTRGQAHATGSTPTEIRVYPVEGPAGIHYNNWLPRDLTVCSKLMVFEIFKHEIAHIISTHRNGRMDDHDEEFVTAYDEINNHFKSNGFNQLIDPTLELWGVPHESYAARVAMSRGAGWIRNVPTASTGCLLVGVALIVIVVVSTLLTS